MYQCHRLHFELCVNNSFGTLRAPYESIGRDIIVPLTNTMERMITTLGDRQICTISHGLAKMEAKWDNLPVATKDVFLQALYAIESIQEAFGFPCIFYAFGQLGVQWTRLPRDLRMKIGQMLNVTSTLKEQPLSNLVHGLASMGAKWETLEEPIMDYLVKSLSQPDCLSGETTQHVANIIWGLGRMEARWQDLPRDILFRAMTTSVMYHSDVELTQIVFGLSLLDASWHELGPDFAEMIADSLSEDRSGTEDNPSQVQYLPHICLLHAGNSPFSVL